MKILLLADLHGDKEVLDKLGGKAGKYERVIVAGDLGDDEYIEKLLGTSDNIYWIPGNIERLEICGELQEKCIHGKKIELGNGFNIVGFGFSGPTPFGTPGELSEEEIYAQMKGLPIDNKTILVTHSPPYGIMDEVSVGIHAGSKSIRKIMEEKKPLVLACGHIHQAEGKEKAGDTTVVHIPQGNMHKGILLEINGHIHLDVEKL